MSSELGFTISYTVHSILQYFYNVVVTTLHTTLKVCKSNCIEVKKV